MTPKAKIAIIYFVTLIGIIAWLGGIFLTPYLKSQYSPLSGFLYAIFSPTCHQIPTRCFNVCGYPLAVCARCLGIYVGFLIGTLIFPALRGFSTLKMPKAKTFILFSFPIIMDTAGNFLQIWTSSSWVRFFTGLLWGVILPFYYFVGLTDFILRRKAIQT